jgi:hypothetical protein
MEVMREHDVTGLVHEHEGQLRLVVEQGDQPAAQVDGAGRQGVGVGEGVLEDLEVDEDVVRSLPGDERLPQAVDIGLQAGVGVEPALVQLGRGLRVLEL